MALKLELFCQIKISHCTALCCWSRIFPWCSANWSILSSFNFPLKNPTKKIYKDIWITTPIPGFSGIWDYFYSGVFHKIRHHITISQNYKFFLLTCWYVSIMVFSVFMWKKRMNRNVARSENLGGEGAYSKAEATQTLPPRFRQV